MINIQCTGMILIVSDQFGNIFKTFDLQFDLKAFRQYPPENIFHHSLEQQSYAFLNAGILG